MNKSVNFKICTAIALLAAVAVLAGCAGGPSIVTRDAPSVSHIHIGHAITGFEVAPRKQGLLVTAEILGVAVATNNELFQEALEQNRRSEAQGLLLELGKSLEPGAFNSEINDGYGVRRATEEAITHLQLSVDSNDSSANVQRTITRAVIKAKRIVDRANELTAFVDAGTRAKNMEQLRVIASDINNLVLQIAGGPDSNGAYGLFEFREDVEDMITKEEPAYRTVEEFYLFNYVKLPSGSWGFRNSRGRGKGRQKY